MSPIVGRNIVAMMPTLRFEYYAPSLAVAAKPSCFTEHSVPSISHCCYVQRPLFLKQLEHSGMAHTSLASLNILGKFVGWNRLASVLQSVLGRALDMSRVRFPAEVPKIFSFRQVEYRSSPA